MASSKNTGRSMLSFSSTSWQASILSAANAARRNTETTMTTPSKSQPVRGASLIVPRLYLSNFLTARSEKELQALGITHVISVLEHVPKYPRHLKTLHIPIADTSDANILEHLDTTTEFIKSALAEKEDNKILVHCLMGISRSATVVCGYLVATTSMRADEAIEFVISKRNIVCPNLGFRYQLETYALQFYAGDAKAKATSSTTKGRLAHVVSEGIAERIRKLKFRSSGQADKRSTSEASRKESQTIEPSHQ